MRHLFRPTVPEAAHLLGLPWQRPLAEWDEGLLVDGPVRGVSRYPIRFAACGNRVFALKEVPDELARHEYALMGELEREGLPVVSVLGACVDRPGGQPAVLVGDYLEYSVSSRALLAGPRPDRSVGQALDALVQLLVRLHLAGVTWGDCSLASTLFRPDAGALVAHLVDAGSVERHPELSRDRRLADVDLAVDRIGGDLLQLRRDGLLPADARPRELAAGLPGRYEELWAEVTREEVFRSEERPVRMVERLRRLGDLGFDIGEVELVTSGDGGRMRVEPRVAEPARSRQELFRLTGLEVREKQARRLLDEIAAFRAGLEREVGGSVADVAAGHFWLAEVYRPTVDAIPGELLARKAPAEVFHEILEHRWFLSELAGRDVGTAAAARSYFATVLPQTEVASSSAAVLDRLGG